MSSLNKTALQVKETNEVGTPVRSISAEKKLTRMTLAHMLWEDQFYVDGQTSARMMEDLIPKCRPEFVADLAQKARVDYKLRHVPLLLTRELVRAGKATAEGINAVIQRPDEMAELLAIYWKDGKTALSTQLKKGLALAFAKFPEYSLAKWDKNSAAISMRDVMFLVHPKPTSPKQEEMFKRVANKELKTPDTWEVALSGGADKKETFARLMDEGNLGALAFIRNLRNMVESKVDERIIREFAAKVDVSKVLPFRFIAAAKIVPQFEDMLEEMMLRSLKSHAKLPGRTVLVVDTSGSMSQGISAKSDMNRMQAACALAILMREICEDVVIYATAGCDSSRKHATMLIPSRHGFALSDYICGVEVRSKIGGGGIFLVQAMDYVAEQEKGKSVDRVIVFTDEQDTGGRGFEPDRAKRLGKTNYILNVGSYQNGVNSGAWETVTGFSEATVDYIMALETDVS